MAISTGRVRSRKDQIFMRYDKLIYFVNETDGAYDPATGDYGAPTVHELTAWADITDTGTQALTLVYGGLKQGALTIRIQDKVSPFDYIRIAGRKYKADMIRTLPHGQTFIVSEVQ